MTTLAPFGKRRVEIYRGCEVLACDLYYYTGYTPKGFGKAIAGYRTVVGLRAAIDRRLSPSKKYGYIGLNGHQRRRSGAESSSNIEYGKIRR